jgi:TDG/mug DNA glycosylase family protein
MLRDRVKPPVRVLLVGINPGVRSEAIGHHFAGYSNRFWKRLYEAGLTSEHLRAEDDDRLPALGFGVTNLIPRGTPGINTLRPEEYISGIRVLRRKIRRWRPEVVAFVGVTLYRAVFSTTRLGPRTGKRVAGPRRSTEPVTLGLQRELLEGARVFVLPNPSGRNANYSYNEMLKAFRRLRRYLDRRM